MQATHGRPPHPRHAALHSSDREAPNWAPSLPRAKRAGTAPSTSASSVPGTEESTKRPRAHGRAMRPAGAAPRLWVSPDSAERTRPTRQPPALSTGAQAGSVQGRAVASRPLGTGSHRRDKPGGRAQACRYVGASSQRNKSRNPSLLTRRAGGQADPPRPHTWLHRPRTVLGAGAAVPGGRGWSGRGAGSPGRVAPHPRGWCCSAGVQT